MKKYAKAVKEGFEKWKSDFVAYIESNPNDTLKQKVLSKFDKKLSDNSLIADDIGCISEVISAAPDGGPFAWEENEIMVDCDVFEIVKDLVDVSELEGLFCPLKTPSDLEWLNAYKTSPPYQTDGHYGTVYLIGLMLGLPDAKAIAEYAEYPDNIINEATKTAALRTTWGNPELQGSLHALTNGFHGEEEFLTAFALLNMKLESEDDLKKYGYMVHRYGDTYAHVRLEDRMLTDVDQQRMYGAHAHFNYNDGLETGMWMLGGTAEHTHVNGENVGSSPDMIKNDPYRYVKYVINLSELLSIKVFGSVKKIDIDKFRQMAEYAKWNDVSLMGIIHYEIAKFQGLNEFTLPYPILANHSDEDMDYILHSSIGAAALNREKILYEMWLKDAFSYISKIEGSLKMERRKKTIPCGGKTEGIIIVEYEGKFKW